MVAHGGFLIPNADGIAAREMAEPDQVDFNTLGNSRWGVVSGCEVTISGASTTASLSPTTGVVVVNGVVVQVPGSQTVTLGSGGSQPRVDLICVNEAGTLVSVPGTPAAAPVSPDVPATMTLLASVFCPIGSSNFSSTITDKRNMLQSVFVGNSASTGVVLLNRYNGDDTFRILGSGRMEWNNSDTYLQRASAGVLQAHSSLVLDGNLSTDGDITSAGNATITGTLSASNLVRSSSFPTSGAQGTILQRQGRVYVQTSASSSSPSWEEVITASGSNQPGDIKQSMRSPDQMTGWLPLIGQEVIETEHPSLFLVEGLQPFIVNGPVRSMTLPDATNRILLPTRATPGQTGGETSVTLTTNNLPPHRHGVALQPGGAHGHVASTDQRGNHKHLTEANGGAHTHPIKDPGHYHAGVDSPLGTAFIAAQWEIPAKHKLDGPVNDSSHTFTVNAVERTVLARTGITRTEATGSGHQHATDEQGAHGHVVTVTAAENHNHLVSEQDVGGGAAIPIQPPYLTVYTYIKV